MKAELWFNWLMLAQVFVISGYFARRVRLRMAELLEIYPPREYPKLYPHAIEHYQKGQKVFRCLNLGILLAGFGLVGVLWRSDAVRGWEHAVSTWYFLLQCLPFALLDWRALRELKQMRDARESSQRVATLERRRWVSLLSPGLRVAVLLIFVAFVGFVAVVDGLDFPWFGGYWNVVGIAVLNLALAGWIACLFYGRRPNPYQTDSDRRKQLEMLAQLAAITSIAATVFIALSIGLAALDLRVYRGAAQSAYSIFLMSVWIRVYLAGAGNVEVYRTGVRSSEA